MSPMWNSEREIRNSVLGTSIKAKLETRLSQSQLSHFLSHDEIDSCNASSEFYFYSSLCSVLVGFEFRNRFISNYRLQNTLNVQ